MSRESSHGSQLAPTPSDSDRLPTQPVWHNETLITDPIDADVVPDLPVDARVDGPAGESGAIDGLPGRLERQDEEDAEAGLDLTPSPAGASNG